MHITLVCGSLGGGGAERTAALLADGLAGRGHKVTVLTQNTEEPDFYLLRPDVSRGHLLLGRLQSVRWFNIFSQYLRLRTIRRQMQEHQPDVIVSFLGFGSDLLLLATRLWKVPVVVSCQSHVSANPPSTSRKRIIRNLLYSSASTIVLLDQEQVEIARRSNPAWKVTFIPNPLLPVDQHLQPEPVPGGKPRNIVAMGRLAQVKGYDLLLQAFGSLAARYPDWGLVIIGEGELRPDIERDITRRGLTERVTLTGALKQPFGIIKSCDIYVMSSRSEGQGLALIEGMSCGLPAVSFDCPSGPRHIITDEVDGLLANPEDPDSLADMLERLMLDEALRKRMGAEASGVAARYDLETTVDKWLNLFGSLNVPNARMCG